MIKGKRKDVKTILKLLVGTSLSLNSTEGKILKPKWVS